MGWVCLDVQLDPTQNIPGLGPNLDMIDWLQARGTPTRPGPKFLDGETYFRPRFYIKIYSGSMFSNV